MKIAMLAIGDELVDGQSIESNSATLAQILRERGQRLTEVRRVRDQIETIVEALNALAADHDIVITSGGLGITRDDLTRQAVATLLGTDIVEDEGSLRVVKARVAGRGREFAPALQGHATHPDGATVIDNPVGLAIGFEATVGDCYVATFPGVPFEFDAMARQWAARFGHGDIHRRSVTLFGVTERQVEQRLEGLDIPADIHVGICPHDGPLDVSLSGPQAEVNEQLEVIAERLGAHVLGYDASIEALLGAALTERQQTIASAESCTGGLIGSMITDVSGSSGYFLEGVVTYSNDAKMARLGVSPRTLEEHGAVSEATVREMAAGVRRTSTADWGVSSSGIAGPTGGSADKPVGLVHLCVAGPAGDVHRVVYFPGVGRTRVKRRAAYAALTMLLCAVSERDVPVLSAPRPG